MGLSLIIILTTAVFALLICFSKESWAGSFACGSVLVNAGISSWFGIQAVLGIPFEEILQGGPVFGDIPVRVDALSGWFILMMNFTVITGVLYGRRYMKHYENKSGIIQLHFVSFIINHLCLTGIFIVQNSLALLLVWETMAITSFIMVIFEYQKPETIRSGINFLIQSHVCILFLTIGFIWANSHTGSYDFNAIGQYSSSVKPAVSFLLYLCFFIGFAIKAGFVPFHTWLPYAHPVAPSHVSGVMSGVMIKLGIFGILRMLLVINQNYLYIGYFILLISVITGLYGVILAIVQHHLKKLLAYHSIENIGIIGIGTGIGAIGVGVNNSYLAFAGFAGALLHTLNHSLFKSLLFYTSGNIYQAVHSLNIDSMGGLVKNMPRTAILFLIGALAICGLPPFNGFVSEFLIYAGLFEGIRSGSPVLIIAFILSIAGLVLIGGLALLCFTKAFGIIFLGTGRSSFQHTIHEAEPSKLFPGWLIVFFILIIGLFSPQFIKLLINPVNLFTSGMPQGFQHSVVTGNLQSFSIAAWIFILITAGILAIKKYFGQGRKIIAGPTWGCGYVAPDCKMQYTAGSFVRSYRKLFSPLLMMNKKEDDIKGIFSNPIHSHTHPYDKTEAIFIDRPLRFLEKMMLRIRFLQSGNVRHYILYGIFFIIIIISISFIKDAGLYFFELLKLI